MTDPVLLRIHEVAKLLQVSRQTVYRMLQAGTLKSRKLRGCTRITRKSIDDLVSGRRAS